MAEKIEQKPKRTRNTKSKPKEEIVPKSEEITSLESTDNKEIVIQDALVLKTEVPEKEISEEVPESKELASEVPGNREIASEEIAENEEITPKEENPVDKLPELSEEQLQKDAEAQIPKILDDKEFDKLEVPEEVVIAIKKQQKEGEFSKDAKVVLKKLNPNFPDAKSKWASAIMKNTDLHVFFKGSFGKAHKRAENYCILHNLDPKDIQLIRK